MRKLSASIILVLALVCVSHAQKEGAASPNNPSDEIPVSYGLVVDTSGSQRLLLEKIIGLVNDIVEQNKPDDETFLVSFVDTEKIVLQQDFTASKDAISDAADDIYIQGGQTAIIDAVSFSAKHFVEKARTDTGRSRVLILITDGDRKSVV